MGRTLTIVLGGGRGSRLAPLTDERAKPAVPLGGKYRLIDIPLSNSINSGLREIFVLTQFNSASLNAHLARAYRFDMFSDGFVEVLAAEQSARHGLDWFQGTADAVRKHLHRFVRDGVDNVLILSGDHLYRMRYDHLVAYHEEKRADITVSTIPVSRAECEGFGVLAADTGGIVNTFREKPAAGEDITAMKIPPALREAWGTDGEYVASMGVYVFKASVLQELLANPDHDDFGGDILPSAIHTHRVAAYLFDGYWEDIGTIRALYESSLMLTEDPPRFRFFVPEAPIYTRPRYLPPSMFQNAHIERSMVAEGCMLRGARVVHSIVGQRSWLLGGSHIVDSIVMGADFYEVEAARQRVVDTGGIPLGIGKDVSLRRAIIDKNVRIGAGAKIHGHRDRADEDHETHCIRDGIVIVRKNAVIPPGAVL